MSVPSGVAQRIKMGYETRMNTAPKSHTALKSPAALHPGRDHSHCAHNPHRADDGRGVTLTPSRQRVLDELCLAARPVGAYEMMDRLASANGKRPAPISVYRALDFLVDNGLVHRLASRNAFLACGHGHEARDPVVFLICDDCGGVTEETSASIRKGLAALAKATGFVSRAHVIELAGRCAKCKAA